MEFGVSGSEAPIVVMHSRKHRDIPSQTLFPVCSAEGTLNKTLDKQKKQIYNVLEKSIDGEK